MSDGFARLSPVGVDRAGGHRPPLRMVYRTISVGGDTGPYGVRLSDMGRENIGASDMVRENRCRGAHRAPVLPWSAGVDRAGAQYPQGARRIRKAAKPPTAALCAPLHTVYRSIPIDGGRRAGVVAPYGDLYSNSIAGKHGGLCRTTDSEATFKPRGQVVARGAERQRRFTKGPKTGGAFRIPLSVQEQPPPRPKHQTEIPHQSTEAAS